jgi:predicted AlkP superfamily pyrophosphatase or phosphodiesterase
VRRTPATPTAPSRPEPRFPRAGRRWGRPRPFLGLLFLALVGMLTGCAVPEDTEADPLAPAEVSLLVYVVLDQVRADLLDRYAEAFEGGLARFRTEGRRWVNATFDHAQTSTAPGHATAATGVHPHRHGLVGNNWEERAPDGGWETVYALRDRDAPIVGFPDLEGRGPANLLRGGLADWIVSADPESRIVSLSGKDRSAIAMAGRARGEVYWFDSTLGRFMTSTYYRDAMPEWVQEFHGDRDGLERNWSDTIWESTVPGWARRLSRPDTFAYEGDGVNTYFPHRFAIEGGLGPDASPRERTEALNEWRALAPFVDAVTLDLARRAVTTHDLGRRGAVDYLALALSQADRVGHAYGPLSREQQDNLVRLDRELGAFFAFLDQEVGEGRWYAALTADHGVIEIPEARAELGLHGRRIARAERRALVQRAEAAADAAGSDPEARARAAADAAMEVEWVADAFPWDEVLSEPPADSLRLFFTRSYHPDRVLGHLGHLGVAYRMEEGVYDGRYPYGTGHGTPYLYDRHVPMMIMGPGVEAGLVTESVSVVDLAPTLARLLGVPIPDDLDGEVRAVRGSGTP